MVRRKMKVEICLHFLSSEFLKIQVFWMKVKIGGEDLKTVKTLTLQAIFRKLWGMWSYGLSWFYMGSWWDFIGQLWDLYKSFCSDLTLFQRLIMILFMQLRFQQLCCSAICLQTFQTFWESIKSREGLLNPLLIRGDWGVIGSSDSRRSRHFWFLTVTIM